MKSCFRCHKDILKDESYFSFQEFNLGNLVKTDYAHKVCWNKFLNQLGNLEKAQSILSNFKNQLNSNSNQAEVEIH